MKKYMIDNTFVYIVISKFLLTIIKRCFESNKMLDASWGYFRFLLHFSLLLTCQRFIVRMYGNCRWHSTDYTNTAQKTTTFYFFLTFFKGDCRRWERIKHHLENLQKKILQKSWFDFELWAIWDCKLLVRSHVEGSTLFLIVE